MNVFLSDLFWSSDGLSKSIIILFCFFSMYWLITFLWSFGILSRDIKDIKRFDYQLNHINSFDDLFVHVSQVTDLPSHFLVNKIFLFLNTHQAPSQFNITKFEDYLTLVAEDMINQQETIAISMLPVIISIAPLLGLFGTIWGLTNAFSSIGKAHTADLSVIAPGIAAALLTTLGGLFVAIPALLIQNIIFMSIRTYERELFNTIGKLQILSDKLLQRGIHAVKKA